MDASLMKDALSLQVWTAPAEFQFAMACKGFKGLWPVKGFKHKPAFFQDVATTDSLPFTMLDFLSAL